MAMSPYYVQYLLTQGDLFGRILSFNADFSAKQRTLRQQDPNAITDSLYRLHPQLARFHEEHNISYYFERPVDRYCLLKNDELDQLIIYLGACISAQQLARITVQSELDQVYEAIGRDVYNFALDYGYLIKNFDYEPNLSALKQDCAYLGLCAIKGLSTLFSSQELGEYFTDKLIAYTKERKLNPSIITSHTHVLSTVDTPATLMKAPAPELMNTPVQYAPIDAHPARDPAQALSARTMTSAELNDPVMSAPALTNADLAKRRIELETKRQGKRVNPTPFEHIKGPAFGVIGGNKVVAMSDGVNAYLIDSDDDKAHIEATLAQYTPEELSALTHHQQDLNEPESQVLKALAAQAAAPQSATQSATQSAGQNADLKAAAPKAAVTQNEHADAKNEVVGTEAYAAQDQPDSEQLAAAQLAAASFADYDSDFVDEAPDFADDDEWVKSHLRADPLQDSAKSEFNDVAIPVNAASASNNTPANAALASNDTPANTALSTNETPANAAPASNETPANTALASNDTPANTALSTNETPANAAPASNDAGQADAERAPHAELNTTQLDYEHTALYAGINTKERRAFRAASLRQHEAYQDLVTPPERKRESLEHETLVTLDFSPNQVLELSTLILESQINECWYEYLKP